jgi:methionyl-tRNA formyltransferase
VVALCSWGIGEAVLRAALESEGSEVVGVFTRPVDPSSNDPWRNVVANLALKRDIPVFVSRDASGEEGVTRVRSLKPDVILSAAHPNLLSGDFLRVPRLAALNLHGSLLPRNRGTSPVNWALIRDERETGLTMHMLDEGMDSGDIVYQETVPITDEDSPGTLADRIKSHAAPMVLRALGQLHRGEKLPRTKQDETRVTLAPRLRAADLQIDWRQPARAVWSLIRGTSQSGLGARTKAKGTEVIISESFETERIAVSAGEVVEADNESIWVSCADKCLLIPRTAIAGESGGDIKRGMTLE